MDRNTYLKELETALTSQPAGERQHALAYYAEYLDDAGPQGIDAAIRALGTPARLAAEIKADSAIRGLDERTAEYPPGTAEQANIPGMSQEPAKQSSAWNTVWIVILAIFALPLGLPLAIALASLIFAVLATLFSILLAFAATALSLFGVAVFSIVVGIMLLFSNFASGMFYLGGGLLMLGISLFSGLLLWKLGSLMIKGVAKLFNYIRSKLSRRSRIKASNYVQAEVAK